MGFFYATSQVLYKRLTVSNIQTIDKIKIKNLFWQEYSNKTDPLITKYILKQYKTFFSNIK